MSKNYYKLLTVFAVLCSFRAFTQEVGQVERLVSPEITASNDVIFRIKAPAATSVKWSGRIAKISRNDKRSGGRLVYKGTSFGT